MSRKPSMSASSEDARESAQMQQAQTQAQSEQADDLAQLRAQRDALNAQIKRMKDTRASLSKLERVIAQQTAHMSDVSAQRVTARVVARIRAGQAHDDALNDVLATYRAHVEQTLAALSSADASADTTQADASATDNAQTDA